MKTLHYQEKAIKELIEKSIDLLKEGKLEQNLVFKAPTGSGKTIMATRVLAGLYEELEARGMPQVAFVWIAPQKLHLQSFKKLRRIFAENHELTPILYDDIDQSEGIIKPGEILFVNWESVNKDNTLMVRERENADSFFEIIDRTRLEQGRPVYLIVDEEHRNWSRNADKSLAVVEKIHPTVELRISATPKTQSFNTVTIPRYRVVEEEMIKKGIYMNEDIDVDNEDANLNMHLLHKALDMREKMAKEYERLGVNINPLLLIQLPNDTTDTLNSEESTLAQSLIQCLDVKYNITETGGKLGTWLSNKKTIGPEISENDDMTQVLLFKQAIALGWDCPRAAVLLIFRKLEAQEFTVQTLGRILRMPEQHFYTSDILNYGHVYTDISRDAIRIAAEDSDYISKKTLRADRRENLKNIALPSFHQERKAEDQNRLGSKFKQYLLDEFGKFLKIKVDNTLFSIAEMEGWNEEEKDRYQNAIAPFGTSVAYNRKRAEERGINLNVKNINVKIPKDILFQNDLGTINVTGNTSTFARTESEMRKVFEDFCRKEVIRNKFEPKKSTAKLVTCLYEVMEELFGVIYTEVPKIIMSKSSAGGRNIDKFQPIIEHALEAYAKSRQNRLEKVRERSFKETLWEVPEMRFYNTGTNEVMPQVRNHALMPFIALKSDKTEASKPERDFEAFLEKNTQYIDWWYKNGDEGMTNYSIPYTSNDGKKALFYVDFVIRMKNGQIFLFDTKSQNSDSNAPAKHNALLKYMDDENKKGQRLDGGVIIGSGGIWRYSKFAIDNTSDLNGWTEFYPDQYK